LFLAELILALGLLTLGGRNPFVNQVVCFENEYWCRNQGATIIRRNPFVNQVVCFRGGRPKTKIGILSQSLRKSGRLFHVPTDDDERNFLAVAIPS